jgi:hypothetical protein
MTGPGPSMTAGQTVTVPAPRPAPAGTGRPPAPATASHQRTAQARRSLAPSGTPAILRWLLIALSAASLAWGAVGAWAVSQHASAASEVVTTGEPLSITAQQMYRSLSDADVTATTAFLAGPPEPLSVRQRYEADIARAAADLAALRNAGTTAGAPRLSAGLAAVSTGLPVYTGYVQQAQTYSSLGYPLTGGSFMQVASEEMHLTLLPAAASIYAQQIAALTTASAQATGLPWIVITLLLAIAIAIALLRTQRWLRRRTHRVVNYGLLAATAAVLISTIWLVIAFASARSDFQQGLGHGSTPAEILAQAGIAAQQARGDEVLNLISRSGSSSFQQDFTAERQRIGPGPGTLLSAAAAASPAGPASNAVAAAGRDARSWYATAGEVFRLDLAASYGAETQLVIGTGPTSSAAGFAKLESDLSRAIAADQIVFRSAAAAGSGAFGGLEIAVAIAALLMATGSYWGLSRRLAEYR